MCTVGISNGKHNSIMVNLIEQSVEHTEKHIKYKQDFLLIVPAICNLALHSELSQKHPCLCIRTFAFNIQIWNFLTHLSIFELTYAT